MMVRIVNASEDRVANFSVTAKVVVRRVPALISSAAILCAGNIVVAVGFVSWRAGSVHAALDAVAELVIAAVVIVVAGSAFDAAIFGAHFSTPTCGVIGIVRAGTIGGIADILGTVDPVVTVHGVAIRANPTDALFLTVACIIIIAVAVSVAWRAVVTAVLRTHFIVVAEPMIRLVRAGTVIRIAGVFSTTDVVVAVYGFAVDAFSIVALLLTVARVVIVAVSITFAFGWVGVRVRIGVRVSINVDI